MQLAKVQKAFGQTEKAEASWRMAGIYLVGYGWRKDVTLFDIIESVPALFESSKDSALKALESLQPLIAAVLLHTDGRETKHTPNTWFSNLLSVDPSSAINVLARTILEEDCVESWPTIKALQAVAKYSCGRANPILVDALWETLPFEVEYENDGKKVAKEYRLKPEIAEIVIRESDKIFGGIGGFVITSSDNIMAPNAGIDKSNAKKGLAILYPTNPYLTAEEIRRKIFLKFLYK